MREAEEGRRERKSRAASETKAWEGREEGVVGHMGEEILGFEHKREGGTRANLKAQCVERKGREEGLEREMSRGRGRDGAKGEGEKRKQERGAGQRQKGGIGVKSKVRMERVGNACPSTGHGRCSSLARTKFVILFVRCVYGPMCPFGRWV